MASPAAPVIWSRACLLAGAIAHGATGFARPAVIWGGALAAALILAQPAAAQPVKGEASLSNAGGYARLIIKLDKDVESEASISGQILIVRFKMPVDIAIDKLAEALPDYVGSTRPDPDGRAIRLALTRKVTVNSILAGERLFIDMMPDDWNGAPPPLPENVVRELADRARAAERELRRQKLTKVAKPPLVRVRASKQPTFVRLVFELPDNVSASSDRSKDALTLVLDRPVTFDLADAKLALPPSVLAIDQRPDGDASVVSLSLVADTEVHAFSEDKTYVVDVGVQVAAKPAEQVIDQAKAALAVPNAKTPAEPSAPIGKSTVGEPPAVAADPAPKAPIQAAAPAVAAPQTMPVKPPAPPAAQAATSPPPVTQPVKASQAARLAVEVKRNGTGLELTFPFNAPTGAAVFSRANALWLVFDNDAALDLQPIGRDGGAAIRDVMAVDLPEGQAVRIRLSRPQLAGIDSDGRTWRISLTDTPQSPPQPLSASRNMTDPTHARVSVPFVKPGKLFRLADPDAGDTVMVVTAPLPARGFIRPQRFVDLTLPETAHGVVVSPTSDDVTVKLTAEAIMLDRPGGLTVSVAEVSPERAPHAARQIIDTTVWRSDQQTDFIKRRDDLIAAAAWSVDDERVTAHLNLARFYLAHRFYQEADGILNTLIAETKSAADNPVVRIVHAIANIMRGTPAEGLTDLADIPDVYNNAAQLWKAVAFSRQGKWADARDKFKSGDGLEFAIASLPVDLQRAVILDALRASLELRDYTGASSRLNEMDIVGIPPDLQPPLSILRGRIDEALGREKEALNDYRRAIESADRGAATEARLREIELLQKRNEISPDDALTDLEALAVTWRGDALEVKTLQLLAQLYAGQNRYRDAFMAARQASLLQPDSEISRRMQDDASALFADVFLERRGEDLTPVEALATFYEFRELTPIGRRGDEMIRKLVERLVAVDLLAQASELLQYQIDSRLDGAARAQVAARLAMVYLMNRKPDRAIAVLHATRTSDLASELRQQRLLLEARALSDVGRHELALEIIATMPGREAMRLRSDIHWAARRWREASEQIELMYGERWRDFQPLTAPEKADILRVAVGYSLAEDTIGLARLREKYAAKLLDEADRDAFDAATKLTAVNGADFVQIARMAASVDTLDGFLRDMRVRFSAVAPRSPASGQGAKPDPSPTGALPQIVGKVRATAQR